MATQETNEAKRDLMARCVASLEARGWSRAQIAAWMRVTTATVGRWRHGNSMGTNAQRAELAGLPAAAQHAPRVRELCGQLDREAGKRAQLVKSAADQGAHVVAKSYAAQHDRIAKRARQLRELFGIAP